MIYFTSDLHINHKNIAGPKISQWGNGYRNFDSVEEMNQTIINTLNKYVQFDDTLYFLGDFCFGGHKNTPNYRAQINCQTIHFVKGNHDHHIDLYKDCFTSINDTIWYLGPPEPIFMSHYAHRVWEGSHKGAIHLYGHSHDSIPDYGKSMDVGIDVAYRMFGEYRPFSLNEIVQIMNKRDIAFVDHHNKNTNVR